MSEIKSPKYRLKILLYRHFKEKKNNERRKKWDNEMGKQWMARAEKVGPGTHYHLLP